MQMSIPYHWLPAIFVTPNTTPTKARRRSQWGTRQEYLSAMETRTAVATGYSPASEACWKDLLSSRSRLEPIARSQSLAHTTWSRDLEPTGSFLQSSKTTTRRDAKGVEEKPRTIPKQFD